MTDLNLRASLHRGLLEAELSFTPDMEDKLLQLVEMLSVWNARLNLTAVRTREEMIVLHILDSAVISPLLEGEDIADVGTGAGFPGLVLAILNPDRQFTLIDSVGKKLSFVTAAITSLKLKNVKVMLSRVEKIRNRTFDEVVSRAFAPLGRMATWCLPILGEEGRMLAMKANLSEEELKDLPPGVKIKEIRHLTVPMLDATRQAVFLVRDKQ